MRGVGTEFEPTRATFRGDVYNVAGSPGWNVCPGWILDCVRYWAVSQWRSESKDREMVWFFSRLAPNVHPLPPQTSPIQQETTRHG